MGPFGKISEKSLFDILQRDVGGYPDRPNLIATNRGLDDEIWDVLLSCWSKLPENRPSSTEIANRLYMKGWFLP